MFNSATYSFQDISYLRDDRNYYRGEPRWFPFSTANSLTQPSSELDLTKQKGVDLIKMTEKIESFFKKTSHRGKHNFLPKEWGNLYRGQLDSPGGCHDGELSAGASKKSRLTSSTIDCIKISVLICN
jgi:hypothetical protein